MYGYLKIDDYCPESIKHAYKKYYCYLCRSLGEHYGFKSRFILSYDVTLFLICVTNEDYLKDINKITCFNKEAKKSYGYKFSQKIAALSLLLLYYKIKDDLIDENSFKAKLLYFLYKRKIKKAQKDFELMDKIISNHYSKITELENNLASVDDIGMEFSLLLTDVAEQCFELNDQAMILSLKYLGRWVYFIDAVDDLDDDIKKKRFNPFKEIATSLNQLVNEKYITIKEYLDLLNNDLNKIKFNDSINNQIIKRIIFHSIPDTMFKIMK